MNFIVCDKSFFGVGSDSPVHDQKHPIFQEMNDFINKFSISKDF